jgi:hypothetical protein
MPRATARVWLLNGSASFWMGEIASERSVQNDGPHVAITAHRGKNADWLYFDSKNRLRETGDYQISRDFPDQSRSISNARGIGGRTRPVHVMRAITGSGTCCQQYQHESNRSFFHGVPPSKIEFKSPVGRGRPFNIDVGISDHQ